ncbi:MAG TPA: PHP domain-containing protein [Candidatus Saccharimonadia bacterium]|jgi:predicted metal-dependent phosphoesterase TrpH|nr:PHP domain-containing protein [Candidatus Saccharimonadia bacterium]
MSTNLPYESLHNHTIVSDGTQTYLEVLEAARRNKVGVVAFTDHDTLPGAKDLETLKAYDGPVKWLVGCEISSGLPRELGGGVTSSLHILGLFTDPTNVALLEHCKKAVAARNERMERIVANLKKLGFNISVQDCLEASGGENVGRPHIVRALNSHPENAAVIDQIRADMEKAAVGSAQVAMDYAHMMERPPSDYPYRLFLSDDAFVPGVYVDYLYSIDLDEAVRLIRGAGGVAIVAHWYTVERKINSEMLEGLIRDGRIDGMELMGNPINSAARRAEPVLRAMAVRTGCITTYGIDGHKESDMENFVADQSVAGKSVGQTAKLIERTKPALGWSNFSK